jgi:hypothetical protein
VTHASAHETRTVSAAVDITRNYRPEDIHLAAALVTDTACESCGQAPATTPVNFTDGGLFFVCRSCAMMTVEGRP